VDRVVWRRSTSKVCCWEPFTILRCRSRPPSFTSTNGWSRIRWRPTPRAALPWKLSPPGCETIPLYVIWYVWYDMSISLCRSDLVALDRLLDLFAHRFYVLVLFLSVLVIPTCGRLSWPALWSTFGRTKNSIDLLIDWRQTTTMLTRWRSSPR